MLRNSTASWKMAGNNLHEPAYKSALMPQLQNIIDCFTESQRKLRLKNN